MVDTPLLIRGPPVPYLDIVPGETARPGAMGQDPGSSPRFLTLAVWAQSAQELLDHPNARAGEQVLASMKS